MRTISSRNTDVQPAGAIAVASPVSRSNGGAWCIWSFSLATAMS
jgi:hypothetical protein